MQPSFIEVSIKMLPPSIGRQGPTAGNVWKCRLKINDRFLDEKLTASNEQFVPGQDANASLVVLSKADEDMLVPGVAFECWELKKVAEGIVMGV